MALAGSSVHNPKSSGKPRVNTDPKAKGMAGSSGIRPGRLKKKAMTSTMKQSKSTSVRPSSGMR